MVKQRWPFFPVIFFIFILKILWENGILSAKDLALVEEAEGILYQAVIISDTMIRKDDLNISTPKTKVISLKGEKP